jgi:hypothetical protein
MQKQMVEHLPPAYGAKPPYATELSAHCGFYYTACFSFCTGGKWGQAWAFEALYMDEESVYGAFFVPCRQTPGGALTPLTRPAFRLP